MPYNPKKHHRRSIRLNGYDYAQAGAYFITICCDKRICRFGDIANKEMILNEYGQIAYHEWIKLADRFTNFELDVFQIMPNHMHGIIVLNPVRTTLAIAPQNAVRATLAVAPVTLAVAPVTLAVAPQNDDSNLGAEASPAPTAQTDTTMFDIVGAYKSLVTNKCLDVWKLKCAGVNPTPMMGKLWQRNYYEHIIRNEQSYKNISNYIINNPAKWNDDKWYNK